MLANARVFRACSYMARCDMSRKASALMAPLDRKANDTSWYQGWPPSVVPEA